MLVCYVLLYNRFTVKSLFEPFFFIKRKYMRDKAHTPASLNPHLSDHLGKGPNPQQNGGWGGYYVKAFSVKLLKYICMS